MVVSPRYPEAFGSDTQTGRERAMVEEVCVVGVCPPWICVRLGGSSSGLLG